MPQKGQIIKHEWDSLSGYGWWYKCPHCECVKIAPDIGHISYVPKGHKGASISVEPPCITRPKPE